MNLIRYFLIFNIIISIFACNNKPNTCDINKLDLIKSDKVLKLKDVFADFEILSLDTNGGGAFQNINKLVFHDDRYYIMDKTGKRQILVFDSLGVYQCSIGNPGKGKGEYINIEDFTIDEQNNRIVILAYPSTVYTYSLNGKFLFSKKIDENTMLWDIINTEEGFICSTNHMTYTEGEHAYLLYFFDKDFKMQSKQINVLPVQVALPPFVSNSLLKTSANSYFYFDSYTARAYKINNSTLGEVYELQLDNPIPVNLFADINGFMDKQMDYDFFMNAINIENQLLAFYKEGKQIRGFKSKFDNSLVETFRYDDWVPQLMYQNNGIIYSTINNKFIETNKHIFDTLQLMKVTDDYQDKILKFRCVLN